MCQTISPAQYRTPALYDPHYTGPPTVPGTILLFIVRNGNIGRGWISYLRKGALYTNFSIYVLLITFTLQLAQLVRGFALSDLLDKPWPRWTSRGHVCLSVYPPVRTFACIARKVQLSHFSAFYARRLSSNQALALSVIICHFFRKKKVPTSTIVHSGRFEPDS